MTATDRPWYIRDGTNIFMGDRLVANTGGYSTSVDPAAVLQENRDNAEYIVKAVNEREELVECLKGMMEIAQYAGTDDIPFDDMHEWTATENRARALLAKIGGE